MRYSKGKSGSVHKWQPPDSASVEEINRAGREWLAKVQSRAGKRRNRRPGLGERLQQERYEAALAEVAARFEVGRGRPLAERVDEYVILTDDEGNYAGLERSAPQG